MREASVLLRVTLVLMVCCAATSCATAPLYGKVAAESEKPQCIQSRCWARWVGKDSGDAFSLPSASEQEELQRALSGCVTALTAGHGRGVIYKSLADRRLKSCMKDKGWAYWVQEVIVD